MTSHDRRLKGPIPEFVTRYSSMESARRKHNLEGGPSADVAFDFDPPAVGLDQMPGNGETQSSPSGLAGARCIDAVEARSREAGGTGLGLSIARHLVEA